MRRRVWLLALIVIGGVAGCHRSHDATPPPPSSPSPSETPSALAFGDAVTETGSEEQQPPPERTMTGLSTAKLRVEVQRLWNEIVFRSPAGRPLEYSAELITDLGPIRIVLLPDVAPNHVRNFVALARAGYYDGLQFDDIIDQKTENGDPLQVIEAGCPLGTGEAGVSHLGYWLKPEFSALQHEPGSVGACRGEQPDTAACRFYISLTAAPAMDGYFTIFGRVTQGLDVVRTIYQQPRAAGSSRPDRPVVMRAVRIQVREADSGASERRP